MRFFAIIVTLWVSILPAAAQDTDPIEDVIGGQLDAFNARDIATAWTFASPMIQQMFGNPGRFGAMVEQGYPMVWDNAEAAFMEREGAGGMIVQKVFVRGPDGRGWVLSYAMIPTTDGWRINGVSVVPAPELAA